MQVKRRYSNVGEGAKLPTAKRTRIKHPDDFLSDLSDELLIRILHHLPIRTLIQCQELSHRFYTLAGDSQIWKNLYYNRFVLPRALRIPGVKAAQNEESLHFSSRRSKWLEEHTLVNREDGKKTNWKRQYKLRHNWSIGACEVQEIHVADQPSVPSMLVKLAGGIVLTVNKEDGLRAWDLKNKLLIAEYTLGGNTTPACLAVDEESRSDGLGIAVGFMDGGWGTWKLDTNKKNFEEIYRHPGSSNAMLDAMLDAIAFANPYILTITETQLLSMYTFAPVQLPTPLDGGIEDNIKDNIEPLEDNTELENISTPNESASSKPQATLLASLKSHTSWPPLSLSIRTTSKNPDSTIIASIAYSLPTYYSGYTIGLQELHLSPTTGNITFSRLASALPQGFSSVLSSPTSSGKSSPALQPQSHQTHTGSTTRPTTLSYSHPYILATHPDNTLTLYLCTSTSSKLSISPGTKLWGHTSSISSASITQRGKAVSVSTRGNELRVWELEGGFTSTSSSTASQIRKVNRRERELLNGERSVIVRHDEGEANKTTHPENLGTMKHWVGFDDEVVIVLKESEGGTQALMVYNFS
ncbi:hypothetical protein BGZ60DRAFT_423173 [Tricladium varicosporioides]|nr:hypothetical protein BGZ60DRAFT_423173 [Hymenoscyphus varicosporioides]